MPNDKTTTTKEYLKKFILDCIDYSIRYGYIDDSKIHEYFYLHESELKTNLAEFNLQEEKGLIHFILTEPQINKHISSQQASLQTIIIKIILLLEKSKYTINEEDVIAIEDAQIYRHNNSEQDKFLETVAILQLYYRFYAKTGKYLTLHSSINLYEEDYLDTLLNKYNNIVDVKVLNFYKECYLKTRVKKQLSLLFQMDNQYTGWHPRAIRETLRLLIPLYLTINRADIKELYPYINHEQELNELLNNFTKNLLPNTNTQDNIDRFREIILNNQPLPITARCTKHAVGILIYNGYLVYFNTGHTTNPLDSGAMYYKIPNIAALLNYTVTEQDDYSRRVVEKNFLQRLSEFFPTVAVLEKFVADLVTSGLLIRIYLQNIPPQEVGDCSMRALSYLVPAMLTIKIQEQQSSTLSWTQKAKWAVVKHTLLPLQNFAYRKNQNYKNSNYMWTLSNLHNAETIKFRKATKIAFAAWEKMYEHAKNIFLENILALGILEPEFIDEVSNHIKKEATDKLAPHNIGIIIQQDKFTSTRIGIDYVHRSTMQFWQASQSKRPIFAQKYGFNVIPIPGDGHCLFNAVSLYLDNTSTSPRALRTKVANHIEDHLEQYQDIITALNPDTTVEMHIRAIRDHEWADNLEIAVLMRVLDRPIYVIDSDGKIRNRGINITGSGDPIFVYYNGHNHYDGLLIQAPEMTGQEILELLILENRASIVQLPATRQPQIFKNMKKRKIDQTEINHNDLEPAPKKRRIF